MAVSEAHRPVAHERAISSATAFAWLVAVFLGAALVWAGGLWNQLANSRLLDLLMRSGVVAFTDADQGFYRGVPDTQYYVASQDPIDWGMILLTAGLLLAVYALRAVRFASVARFLGTPVQMTEGMRSYIRGFSAGAFRPFGTGRAIMADSLEERGVSRRTAGQTLLLVRFFTILELIVFTVIGLVALSWSTALGQLVWAAAILGFSYLVVRAPKTEPGRRGPLHGIGDAAGVLSQEPGIFARLGAISLLAFFLEVVAIYALTQAFSSENVILNIDFPVVLMALVAGYLASFIEITPGGFGQFEWGMTTALYIGGLGLPEAVTAPLLYAGLRYSVVSLVYLVTRIREQSGAHRTDLVDELERG